MALPSNVSFFMQRLAGVSTSSFKVQPMSGGDSSSANKILRFPLPSNTLLRFDSVRMFFNASTGAAAAVTGGRLPNKIDSLIERVSIYMGGTLVQNNFQSYNLLRHVKDAMTGSKCDGVLGHPEIVRSSTYHGRAKAALGTGDCETYDREDEQFCIEFYDSFLTTVSPSIVDTGLLPEILVEVVLAENAVCPSVSGPGLDTITAANAHQCVYTLSNISMQCEVLGMATSVLDQISESRIAQVGYLSLPFKSYYSFVSSHDGTTRFSVNSASWDRVWFAYRPTDYHALKGAHRVPGFKTSGANTATVGQVASIDLGVSEYDSVMDTNKERYISHYFRMKEPLASDTATRATYQLQINGASVPAYKCTAPEMYSITKHSVEGYHLNDTLTMQQYYDSYFIQCFRFNLPDSEFSRLASGLDTRSVSSQCALVTEGLEKCNLTIFAECTQELRVGNGRSIEIIS